MLNSGEFYQKSYLRVTPGSIAETEPGWLLSGPVRSGYLRLTSDLGLQSSKVGCRSASDGCGSKCREMNFEAFGCFHRPAAAAKAHSSCSSFATVLGGFLGALARRMDKTLSRASFKASSRTGSLEANA